MPWCLARFLALFAALLRHVRAQDDDLFCFDGHRLPQFFLLGGQKCATTSMTDQMKSQWGVTAYSFFLDLDFQDPGKEPHFFGTDRVRKGLAYYARSFPKCAPHVVSMDATPTHGDATTIESLYTQIRAMYGPERIARTTFAMLLCNPYQRVQSDYYQYAAMSLNGFTGYDLTYPPPNASDPTPFKTFVDKMAVKGEPVRTVDPQDLVTSSKYAVAISIALRVLGNLAIIPSFFFKHHADVAIGRLLDIVAIRSGFTPPPTNASEHTAEGLHSMPLGTRTIQHPTLADDISTAGYSWLARCAPYDGR